MSEIADCVLEWLSNDMVSHGWLVQRVEQEDRLQLEWTEILEELLSGNVEIGDAQQASSDYLEFVAWKGKIKERVSRAVGRVQSLANPDREFAYWLALRKNVDRFEGDRQGDDLP